MTDAPLFIISLSRDIGGAEKSITALLPELGRASRVFLFASHPRHVAEVEALRLPGIEIVPCVPGLSFPVQLRNLRTLYTATRRHRPRAILANGHRGCFLLFFLQFLPMPSHPLLAVYVRDFAYHFLRYGLWAMRNFLFLAPTPAIYDDPRYVAWGLLRRRHFVLGNSVAPSAGHTIPEPGKPRFVGCCARIVPWKGIDYLLRAFALVVEKEPLALLRIYGEPVDRAYFAMLEEITRELSIEANVEFHPFVGDTAAIYRQGLFFVVPSLSIVPGPESFCRIIIEAWAAERPVIAFSTGGPKYLIQDGRDGLLVEERNVEELAAAISKLLATPALVEEMGRAGQARITREFVPEVVARELLTYLTPP